MTSLLRPWITRFAARGVFRQILLLLSIFPMPLTLRAIDPSKYNVVWKTPSKDASGVMPIGNGDIAAGVYAIEDGDLYLLLAKNDAYTYLGDLFKTGRVKVSISPNPFRKGAAFKQTLDLPTGSILIEADGMRIRIWADALRPVFHLEVSALNDVAVSVQPEFWKRIDNVGTYSVSTNQPTQDVRLDKGNTILWYYAVGDRSIFPDDLKMYEVEGIADRLPDPFRFNTFGNLLECPSMISKDGALCGKGKMFDIRIHGLTKQTPKPDEWIGAIETQASRTADVKKDWDAHCQWWADFWDRGWIAASDRTLLPQEREKFIGEPSRNGVREELDSAALISQSYNVFRFLMACQSRGRVQVKFNGGIFTQQLKVGRERSFAVLQPDGMWLTNEDDRMWGRRFTFQNQRLIYWPLLMSGDFDLMRPFFGYYGNLLPIRKAITKAWFGHEGAYYRENIEPDGAERDCGDGKPPKVKPGENQGRGYYHSFYFTCGLETIAMMLDYANYTGDLKFRNEVLLPFAREVLLFFNRHYLRDPDGKLRIDPAQVLETWWVAVNPAPDVAGLHRCLDGLLAMNVGTVEDQAQWKKFRAEIPEIPMRTIEGRQALAPAAKWEKQHNGENGELYPVFPFGCFSRAHGNEGIVEFTMKHRTVVDGCNCCCWSQDQIDWALAGNAKEAAKGLERRFRTASTMCRFPMFGKEGPDSCPDFDHFGSGAIAFQRMLVQEAGSKILLLPAWPAAWDVDFKLHLARNTVLTGQVKDGKLVRWDICPKSRKLDVTVCDPQPGSLDDGAIPKNQHPLRVGMDQVGNNSFAGQIGRVSIFRHGLSPKTVKELAGLERTKLVSHPDLIGCWQNPKAGDTLPLDNNDFSGAVSFEAWICPGKNEQGRILDKTTPGGQDGFLLDTWPNCAIRFIVGSQQTVIPGALQTGVWQHLAVVASRGKARIYVNGEEK